MERARQFALRIQLTEKKLLKELYRLNIEIETAFKQTFYLLLFLLFIFLTAVFFMIRNHFLYRAEKEQEIFLKNQWHQQTLASLGDGVITTNANGMISFLNKAATLLTGWEQQQAVDQPIRQVFRIINEDSGTEGINPLLEALQKNKIAWLENHTILIRKDNSRLFIDDSAAPIHDVNGKTIGGVLVFRDITEKKKAEDEIKRMNAELEQRVEERARDVIEKEKRYRRTLDNMLEGAQIIGFDWRYIYLNDAVEKQSKLSRKELLGYTFMEKYPGIEDSEFFKILQQCMTERKAHAMENKFVYPDSSSNWFKLNIEPVPEGLFILSMDISESKKADQEKQEYLKSLEEMLFMVSHKIRLPVSNILGLSYLLDSSIETQKELKQISDFMKESALLLDNFTAELNSFIDEAKHKKTT